MSKAFRTVDCAERWKVSETKVRAMIRSGELQKLPFGGKLIRIAEAEVLRWEEKKNTGSVDIAEDTPSSGTRMVADAARRSARLIAQAPKRR